MLAIDSETQMSTIKSSHLNGNILNKNMYAYNHVISFCIYGVDILKCIKV